jgi:PPOX class probable F420-dependent enzyme
MNETVDDPLAALLDSRVRDFLFLARVARLATASREAMPHVVPVCFCFDGLRFYFAIDAKPKRQRGLNLKRMRNIAENPAVALVIDHFEEDWAHLAYVLVHGHASVVQDPQEYMLAMRRLRDKYAQYRAMALSPEQNPMVRIEPHRVHVWGQRFAAQSHEQSS